MTPPIVKRYLIALDRHKLLAIVSFAAITGVSGFVALQQEPPPVTYMAQGVLAFNNPPTSFSTTGEQIQQQGKQLTPEILLSENVIEAAAAKANVEPQEIVKNIKLELPGAPKKGEAASAQVITLKFRDDNPQQAGTVVDVLMQKMVEQSRLVNTARLRSIIQSIENRLPDAKTELTTAEQQIERYDRIEGAALLAAQDGTLVSAITGSQQQQRQIQLTLEGVETQINSLVNKLGLTPDEAYTSSALSADPIIANMRAQILQTDTQIALLRSQGYRDAHPNVATLLQQQQTYEQMLQQRAGEVIGGNGVGRSLVASRIRQDSSLDPARQQLANNLVNLQTQQETLIQQLQSTRRTEQELRQQYQNFPNKQLERGRLAQQLQLKQDFYNKLEVSLADAKAAETETVSSLSIAQPPQVSEQREEATSPLMMAGVGIFIAFVVSGGLIFMLASLDNKLYTSQEIREILAQQEVPVLGELPLMMVWDRDPDEPAILSQPNSPYLEFYERFRATLRRAENKSLKVVMLTSTVEQEGKTVSAYNLAVASAQAGKRTLLVEADLRSPSPSKFLKVICDPDARIEPLRYYANSGCIRLVPDIENLYIVPSPGPQRQAAAIMESSEFRQFLEDARGRFDFVVIDTPALSHCNDALLLEPLTDGMVIVARPGYTQGSILSEAVDELTEAELPLLGTIINGVDRAVPRVIEEVQFEEEEYPLESESLEAEEENVPTGAMRR